MTKKQHLAQQTGTAGHKRNGPPHSRKPLLRKSFQVKSRKGRAEVVAMTAMTNSKSWQLVKIMNMCSSESPDQDMAQLLNKLSLEVQLHASTDMS